MPEENPPRGSEIGLVAIAILLSSAWILSCVPHLSATFDEPFYLNVGLTSWRTGKNKLLMKAGTMPLPVDVQTLPLYLMERNRGSEWDFRSEFNDALMMARRMNLIFWGLLLFSGWRLARRMGGPFAGIIALGLLATEPNLLGHAGLATTDIALTASVMLAVDLFVAGRGSSWPRRVLSPGLGFGVALLCKVSALMFVPLIWGIILASTWRRTPGAPFASDLWSTTKPWRRDLMQQLLIGFVLTFAYCGSDWERERTFVEWTSQLPEGTTREVMTALSDRLTIFTNAGEAIAQQIKHNARGHGVYLNGEWHARAVWYYFPVALLVKLTIPVLVLIALTLVFRTRAWAGPLGWVTLALLLFSLSCRVQIGIRLVFPLLVMLILATSVAVSTPLRKFRTGFLAVSLAAIGLQLVTTLLCFPDSIRHVNPLGGGCDHGHRLLSDSNTDWGQGLKELKLWANEHSPDRPIAVWYFGSDPAIEQPPFRHTPLHTLPPTVTVDDIRQYIGPGFLAVGLTIQFSDPNRSPAQSRALELLSGLKPAARTRSFLIYDFR